MTRGPVLTRVAATLVHLQLAVVARVTRQAGAQVVVHQVLVMIRTYLVIAVSVAVVVHIVIVVVVAFIVILVVVSTIVVVLVIIIFNIIIIIITIITSSSSSIS